MSVFTKKVIRVDENLSNIIGVDEGELISYSEITKGIFEYVKKNDLRKERVQERKGRERFCFNCGTKLKIKAAYCDKCGIKQ